MEKTAKLTLYTILHEMHCVNELESTNEYYMKFWCLKKKLEIEKKLKIILMLM